MKLKIGNNLWCVLASHARISVLRGIISSCRIKGSKVNMHTNEGSNNFHIKYE